MILEEPMPRSRLWLTVLVSAALLVAQTSLAAAAPIVFDFEDGLQGWELHGAATRVQTQLLGGEWAIFGDGLVDRGGASIRTQVDLTDIRSITLEQFFVEGDGVGPSLVQELYLIGSIFIGTLAVFEPVSPGNPNLWAVDLSEAVGIRTIGVFWADALGAERAPIVAFIDNITFHPVPEPTALVLLSLGLAWLAVLRRR
jgi:hypothetical protein